MTSPSLEHKYITPDDRSQLYDELFDFFDWAREYIWEQVLPKVGMVKYLWIDFGKYHPYIFYPHVSDSQPPEKVITQSDVKEPPKEVLSPLYTIWEEDGTSSYLGDNKPDPQPSEKVYSIQVHRCTVYREPQTKVLCNHDQDGLETHPGYPDQDESGSQLPMDTLESQPEESPEQGIILINFRPPEMNSGNSEWDKVKDPDPPEVNSESPEEEKVIEYPTYSGPPERDKVKDDGPPEAKSSPPEVDSEPPEEDKVREYPTYSGPPRKG